jgi:catechol 2,3-dioxygenase-like lactoylglutathione lyase family enzyme
METSLHTIFRWCNDVESMQRFYTHCLGLKETFYENNEAHGWLTYKLGEVQLVFMRAEQELPVSTAFAQNPGYAGGTASDSSWVIQANPDEFEQIVGRLQAADFPEFQKQPIMIQQGYKQFLVRDPMGFTVEIYTEPEHSDSK